MEDHEEVALDDGAGVDGAPPNGDGQGRFVVEVGIGWVGRVVEQLVEGMRVVPVRGVHERRRAHVISVVDSHTGGQQQPDDLGVAARSGQVQRRFAVGAARRVDCSSAQQQRRRRRLAVRRCPHQRRQTASVHRIYLRHPGIINRQVRQVLVPLNGRYGPWSATETKLMDALRHNMGEAKSSV